MPSVECVRVLFMTSNSMSGKGTGYTSIQLVILVFLCLQTSSYCVFLSVSKTILHEQYSNAEVLILSEIIKLVVSGIIVFRSSDDVGISTSSSVFYRMGGLLIRGRKLIVLVILYSIANMIPFFAIHYIGAPAFTVIMQMKVFTTAGFSTLMLSRQYSATKWRALILLVIGVLLVSSPVINKHSSGQIPRSGGTDAAGDGGGGGSLSSTSTYAQELLGIGLTLLQATISGFTAVYFEGLLKEDGSSIWERNFQLAFYSIICITLINFAEGSAAVLMESLGLASPELSKHNDGDSNEFLHGWTVLAVVLAMLQGAGGLLVAATLKYADAVLKCFATAVSVIITSIVGYFFLGNKVDMVVALGFITTVLSIFNYTLDHQQVQEVVSVKQRAGEDEELLPVKGQ